MANILIVYHSISGITMEMANAVAEGARQVPNTEVQIKKGMEAGLEDLLSCDGIAVGSPDYFSYMAGGVKDFFDRIYYPSQGKVLDKACVTFASAGGPPATVLKCLDEMCFTNMKFKKAANSVSVSGNLTEEILEECRQLGKQLAEAVS